MQVGSVCCPRVRAGKVCVCVCMHALECMYMYDVCWDTVNVGRKGKSSTAKDPAPITAAPVPVNWSGPVSGLDSSQFCCIRQDSKLPDKRRSWISQCVCVCWGEGSGSL